MIRQTRRTDLDFRDTHRHPRGVGAVVCSTLIVCSECGVGNYVSAPDTRPSPWECTVCAHGVHGVDLEPHLEPGEALGVGQVAGRNALTVDVYVDRDSIRTRPSAPIFTDDLEVGDYVIGGGFESDGVRKVAAIRDGLAGGWRYVDYADGGTAHVTASHRWTLHPRPMPPHNLRPNLELVAAQWRTDADTLARDEVTDETDARMDAMAVIYTEAADTVEKILRG